MDQGITGKMHNLFFFGDNGDVRQNVEFLMSKLPGDVARAVLHECIVIVINEKLDGYYIPGYLIRDKNIIVLNCRLFHTNYQKFITTFFHEVAHHWLKHSVLFGKNDILEEKQEEEADRLVFQWLQNA